MSGAVEYASWDPHFTPDWLSRRVASALPLSFSGAVVDPACGAGNLLVAAAERYGRARQDVSYVGVDVSPAAVRSCRASIAAVRGEARRKVLCGDFLARRRKLVDGPVAVVMNPPFRGYGVMATQERRTLAERYGLTGRFNLAHAFVVHAIRALRPAILVAILPSNWAYSSGSRFADTLASLGGAWSWQDVEGDPFPRVDTHVGILVWRSVGVARVLPVSDGATCLGSLVGVQVRHGTATGRDEAFFGMGTSNVPFGRVLFSVRGRDVARSSGIPIWVPPAVVLTRAQRSALERCVPAEARAALAARRCTGTRRREWFEFHDSIPDWFIGVPKVLVPEIASAGEVRVEVDADGSRFPLHSTIALRAPTVKHAEMLAAMLASRSSELAAGAPRLSGGAVRLQVSALRRLPLGDLFLREWHQLYV